MDYSYVIQSIRYGFPLIFHGISLLILTMSDRYLIKEIISVELAAIYGIAYKFGMMINMVHIKAQVWMRLSIFLSSKMVNG